MSSCAEQPSFIVVVLAPKNDPANIFLAVMPPFGYQS